MIGTLVGLFLLCCALLVANGDLWSRWWGSLVQLTNSDPMDRYYTFQGVDYRSHFHPSHTGNDFTSETDSP